MGRPGHDSFGSRGVYVAEEGARHDAFLSNLMIFVLVAVLRVHQLGEDNR